MASASASDSFEIVLVKPEELVGELTEQDNDLAGEIALIAPEQLSKDVPAEETYTSEATGLKMWLSGGVLGVRCPECNSPMSVRLWLMVADCWGCGCSIELTEDEEREALRLLEEYEKAKEEAPPQPAPAVAKETQPQPVAPKEKPTQPQAPVAPAAPQEPKSEPVDKQEPEDKIFIPEPKTDPRPKKKRKRRPQGKVAAHTPIGVRRRLKEISSEGETTVWLKDRFSETPAWLVSLVVHLLLLIWAALLGIENPYGKHDFTLSARISPDDPVGDFEQDQKLFDSTEFEAPSDFPVEVLATEEVPVIDDTPLNDPASNASVQIDQSPLEFEGSPEIVVGAVGMFDGRGEASRGHLVKAYGGTTASEAAVTKGLRWLASVQESDGSWKLEKFNGQAASTGGTALGVLPFLGAGQTHKDGQYKQTVAKALNWIKKNQGKDGDLRGSGRGQMYAHAQCALALCEAYALTKDGSLREPAQRAINYIVKAQHKAGGWRYQPGQAGDTSVVGWQLMALRSAQIGGLNIPKETFVKAAGFLDTVQASKSGSLYGYMPRQGPKHTMTAEGLLCRQYTGWPRSHPGMIEGVAWMMGKHPPNARQPNMYYWYYATQVMHHYGGEIWTRWNQKMRDMLIATQENRGKLAGSWAPRGGHANSGGRIYMTSLALLTLEVYYRHLPIYERPDLSDATAKK